MTLMSGLYCLFPGVGLLFKTLLKYSFNNPHLKVVWFVLIIQMYFLRKDGERISNEEVSYVLGQELVNACKQKSDY